MSNDIDAPLNYKTVTDGEFKGWHYWPTENFENLAGPFYMKKQADGSYMNAFRLEEKHMNGGGFTHGGCLMAFVDSSIFVIAHEPMRDHYGLTLTCNNEFLAPSYVGQLMTATGEVLKQGRSMVFVRGIVKADDTEVLSFSASMKRIPKEKFQKEA